MTNAQRDGRTRSGIAVEKPDTGRPIPTLTSDPVERARALHELYDAVLSGAATGSVPRSLVSDSWQRSLAARVDPDRHDPPVVHRAADIEGVRAAHPLGAVLPPPERAELRGEAPVESGSRAGVLLVDHEVGDAPAEATAQPGRHRDRELQVRAHG